MRRQPRDAHLAMIGALREKRALSDKTRSRCELVAADMMEIDSCRQELRSVIVPKSPEYSDPLEELAGAWAPFASGLAWAAWCEQDRSDELDEQLGDVRDEELAAIAADVEPPAEVIPMPVTKPGRRAA